MSECQCNLRTRLVGDGCQHCNPAMHAEVLEQRCEDLEAELDWLRAAVQAVLDGVNKRHPNKHRNEWNCPHMAELDRLVPHDDGK